MYPADIADDYYLGYRNVVIKPPIGHPEDGDIGSVHALYRQRVLNGEDLPTLTVQMCFTKEERMMLQDGASVWVEFIGAMPIFSMDVGFGPAKAADT